MSGPHLGPTRPTRKPKGGQGKHLRHSSIVGLEIHSLRVDAAAVRPTAHPPSCEAASSRQNMAKTWPGRVTCGPSFPLASHTHTHKPLAFGCSCPVMHTHAHRCLVVRDLRVLTIHAGPPFPQTNNDSRSHRSVHTPQACGVVLSAPPTPHDGPTATKSTGRHGVDPQPPLLYG